MADAELFRQMSATDVEKPVVPSSEVVTPRRKSLLQSDTSAPKNAMARAFQNFERQMLAYNLEARGIRRVEPDERHDVKSMGYSQIALLWFSINLAANNITLGMLGPVLFGLSFLDASLCAVFGMLVGCLPVAYIAIFGPKSGNRSLIIARYSMGWWPAKLVVILNIIVLLGYALIDVVVAGQILSAVSPHGNLSVIVGIIIVALITWAITTFGYQIIHHYERYAWVPQIIVLSLLAGASAQHYDMSASTLGDTRTRVGNRLSFFSLCLSAAITYAGCGSDYFVYFPEHTPSWKVFSATMLGLTTSFTYAFIVGIGLGTGVSSYQPWSSAYETSQGALIAAGFEPLGTFGKFCAVLITLGLVANVIPPTYSSGVDFQILGGAFAKVPRVVWNTAGVIVYTVCAVAGRANLANIFTNFLALMGYWVSIWIGITLAEQVVFRRKRGFAWADWDDRSKLPVGLAALVAFLVGWAGAVLSMAQFWYVGPFAKMVGEYGADMGNYVGFSWAIIVFLPLRYWELKRYGR